MRLLLDTHAVIWVFAKDARLTATARSVLADAETLAYLSVVSLWEIAIKAALGRMPIDAPTTATRSTACWRRRRGTKG